MRFLFARWRLIRCVKLLALLTVCSFAVFSVITVRKFSIPVTETATTEISQDDVDYFAKNIQLKFRVIKNLPKVPDYYQGWKLMLFEAEIALTNKGNRVFPNFGWSIFFNQVLGVEPVYFPLQSVADIPDQGIRLRHWNGELYSLEPTKNFSSIRHNETKFIRYFSSCCSVAVTDVFPNWYIVFKGLEARSIENTAGEPEQFVAPHDSIHTWKRVPDIQNDNFDYYNPPKAKDRFVTDGVKDLGAAPIPVIPTPFNISIYNPSSTLNLFRGDWVIVSESVFNTAVDVLKEKWTFAESQNLPQNNYIKFIQEKVILQSDAKKTLSEIESYELLVSPSTKSITIKASHAAGAFYAVQSLLALVDKNGNVPETLIKDGPRYRYRGLMIDVARNFHGKEQIKRYIDAMAMYKLNKLHLHLTDDEGWRLEIPDLPELTDIGGRRCHDPAETVCIMPFLGSGPDSVAPGSGFYTVDDYKEILRYAVVHHVEVIPEIDIPGHSHAAIKAMESRFWKMSLSDPAEATRYLLSDLQDESKYASVQNFKDGAMNPCVQSTYTFIEKVVSTLKNIHQNISPLQTFHFGGDEVPQNAWLNSPLCKELLETGLKQSLKQTFAEKVAQIAGRHNLNLAAWEDGLMNEEVPIPRDTFPQKDIFVYAWNNLWSLQQAKRSYTFANAGYKVVLTPATNLYFDHPYEPEPSERGMVWATRYISTRKVYQTTPENIYISEDVQMNGKPIPACKSHQCPKLLLKENIEGIQGSLFGELTRTDWIVDFMMFPRLLALAERAWHIATWEHQSDIKGKEFQEDWTNFANTLGYRELARLDGKGIMYRIPPPGAVVKDGIVRASVEFPGLEVQMSVDGGNVWTKIPSGGLTVEKDQDVLLRTKAAAKDRYSRIVHLE